RTVDVQRPRLQRLKRGADHAPDRELSFCLLALVVSQRSNQAGNCGFVRPQSASERMSTKLSNDVGAPNDEASLGSTQELVSAETHHVGTRGNALLDHRLV